jgi:anti-sigma regulatory factor (Ser/Thr protein kinase)
LLREALTGFPEETLAVAEMLVSELVTNAVQHARSFLVLHINRTWPGLTVLVEDTSTAPPKLQPDSVDAEGGRGLVLVDTLAADWGWERTSTGKLVWFEL